MISKDVLLDLFNDTYKRTINDNQEDFKTIMIVIAKLCSILKLKGILTEEETKIIVDIENLQQLKGDVDDE